MTEPEALRVVQEILIEASLGRTFAALTEPDALATWWRIPGQYQTERAEVDLRTGGRYRLTGSGGMGAFEVHGEYLRVEPPTLLRFTWNPSWTDQAAGSIVEIRLEPIESSTRLTLVHTGFSSADACHEHRNGWPGVLAALDRYLGAR